ncbi:acyltransferase [Deinococcus cellulosilyticus]|uniref:Acetyltransferase n=1 Tax=Deinococcus cellulosilyticus (strain DSM 18568 / NBRC 106333 / KACC 11606 / 5516J-15) TaxID=1223518 RepID=A0A511NC62_DEIC1|nr:acyltransferase [Deinococcus cellulosilyticus]GEM49951.1 acetyltransferase [Deinococcus cellulosilyticus NBRC 106333 = KACC 11606]
MPWLISPDLPQEVQSQQQAFLEKLDLDLQDPSTDRNVLVRDLLAQFLYGRSHSEIEKTLPLLALQLDPRNITFEAEHYAATDPEKFRRVKPLLWLWKNLDLSPVGQNPAFALPFRAVLAKHIFKRVGKNFKCWQNVEFSVGYNMEVGDGVVIHRYAFLDDIGGIELGDGASVSDYVNIYSHTHSVIDSPDVTLKKTTIGRGVRLTYHSTILAGSIISDDALVATHALVRGRVEPHGIAMGLPARTTRFKMREGQQNHQVDARIHPEPEARKANPDFPDPTPAQTRKPGELES